jgi:tRNA U34 2-thiouridine synthase MnmA/TrmU
MTEQVQVHDPRGYPPKVTGKRLAERLETLEGKTVYLVDCLFDNSDVFVDQLRQWFAEHLPATDVHVVRPKESWTDDPALRARIEAEADAAILGVGL